MQAAKRAWRACCLGNPEYQLLHDDAADSRPHWLLQPNTVVPMPVPQSQRSDTQHWQAGARRAEPAAFTPATAQAGFEGTCTEEAVAQGTASQKNSRGDHDATAAGQAAAAQHSKQSTGRCTTCRNSSACACVMEKPEGAATAASDAAPDDGSGGASGQTAPGAQQATAASDTLSLADQPVAAFGTWQRGVQGSREQLSGHIPLPEMHALLASAGVHLWQRAHSTDSVADGMYTYVGAMQAAVLATACKCLVLVGLLPCKHLI